MIVQHNLEDGTLIRIELVPGKETQEVMNEEAFKKMLQIHVMALAAVIAMPNECIVTYMELYRNLMVTMKDKLQEL